MEGEGEVIAQSSKRITIPHVMSLMYLHVRELVVAGGELSQPLETAEVLQAVQ